MFEANTENNQLHLGFTATQKPPITIPVEEVDRGWPDLVLLDQDRPQLPPAFTNRIESDPEPENELVAESEVETNILKMEIDDVVLENEGRTNNKKVKIIGKGTKGGGNCIDVRFIPWENTAENGGSGASAFVFLLPIEEVTTPEGAIEIVVEQPFGFVPDRYKILFSESNCDDGEFSGWVPGGTQMEGDIFWDLSPDGADGTSSDAAVPTGPEVPVEPPIIEPPIIEPPIIEPPIIEPPIIEPPIPPVTFEEPVA